MFFAPHHLVHRALRVGTCLLLFGFGLLCGGCGGSPSDRIEEAGRLIDDGESTKAIEILDEVIRYDSKNASAFIMRGRARERAGEYDRSLDDCNKAVRLNPKLDRAWEARGRFHARRKNYVAANRDLERAARLSPHPAAILSTLGLIHFYQGDYAKARILFDRSTKADRKEERRITSAGRLLR